MFDVGDHCPVIHCQQPLIVMQPDWLFVTQLLPFEPFWYELKQNYHRLYNFVVVVTILALNSLNSTTVILVLPGSQEPQFLRIEGK